MNDKLVKRFVIGTFVSLYALVSIISTIHVIDFFELSNPYWLAVTLAIGFEIGAAASLASLVILKKMNRTIVWSLFIAITLMQMQGNMYYAFINLEGFSGWSELFDLIEEDLIDQKRILAFVSGAILPLIALGFIKSLVDYIKPEDEDEDIVSEGILGDEIPEDEDEEWDPEADRRDAEWNATDVIDDIDLKEWQDVSDKLAKEAEVKDKWDEDHELDMVMNTMVKDMDVKDLEEIRVEKSPIEEVDYTVNPTSVGSIVQKLDSSHLPQDEQALLNQALRDKANKNKDSFTKKDRNDY
ncbi:hypothetical protein OAC86_00935 [bacterium]|nr:hypothetical protein [bacterium]MDB9900088.1 hypothetical protein [bacterium]